MKVLVVDDSETSLILISSYLEKMGHEVITTTNPLRAETLFLTEKPDLVILDVMMEEMDGYEVAHQLREIQSVGEDWIPIIFVSALVDDESIAKGIDAGGDEYLTKPFTEIMLQSKIKAMQRIAEMRYHLTSLTGKLKRAVNRLNQLSLTDELTDIANRRAFDIRYTREWKRSSRLKGDNNLMALVMIDIDHFKYYNDEFGHQAGDQCLQSVASELERLLPRENDEVFRYGGEEFVVILPVTDKEHALKIAERLRLGVEGLRIQHAKEAHQENITVSLGVASEQVTKEKDQEAFLKRADEALYVAKNTGRNRVVYK